MKSNPIYLFVIIFSILVSSCGSGPKPKSSASGQATKVQAEEKVQLNDVLQKKVGSWAKEGAECYGLVLLVRKNKTVEVGKSVKTKITQIQSDSIKVKLLEDVNLAKTKDCSKMGMSTGQTWWEKDGDLFLTKEEADKFLKAKGWEYKDKTEGKFKIGD